MSSSAIEILREKIHSVQRRRHLICVLRQIGWALSGIFAFFLVLGFLEMFFQFALADRITLLVLFLLGTIALTGWHLRKIRELNRDQDRLAHYVEDHLPDLEQRLLTAMEYEQKESVGVSSQLLERLWEDARLHVQDQNIRQVAAMRKVWPAAGAAAVLFTFLLLSLWNSSGFLNASQHILWPWPELKLRSLPVKLIVKPGDIRMQRGADVTLIATVENKVPEQVKLFTQNDRVNWDEVSMAPQGGDQTYVQYFSSVSNDFVYYVDIGSERSRKFQVSVFDMPRIEEVQIEYSYPQYTGMENKTEGGGDIAAPEGTQVQLRATFNKPLLEAKLEFADGTIIDINPSGTQVSSSFLVSRDSSYTIKVVDNDQLQNENPVEYFIRSIPDAPPELKLLKPGGDRKVTSLEEISIFATVEDDYGVDRFVLHYSVAGQEEQQIPLLKEAKIQEGVNIEEEAMIYLEDLNVQPGDFISYYLTAADNNGNQGPAEVFSDIYFLEVISTDREFRRASGQQGGGGGGGGFGGGGSQQSSALAQNQKQIITATWKLLKRQNGGEDAKFKEDIEVVAEAQMKVLQRAQMSFRRLAERLSFSDESYDDAVKNMKEALEQMEIAEEKLRAEELKDALGPEQEALKAILKAESKSRRTQLQMAQNQRGQGGGSREQREREDLLELFSMEMGRLENRYELQPQASRSSQSRAEEDPLAKLQELARRQERLNRSQKDWARQQKQMTEEQKRRRLEQLRREQEELQRRAEELSQQMSRLSQQRGGGQMANRQRQLQQAAQQMQEASRSLLRQETGKAASESRKALENLRNQEREMERQQSGSLSSLVDALNKKAGELTARERQIQQNLQNLQRRREADVSQAETSSENTQSQNLAQSEAQSSSENKIEKEQELSHAESRSEAEIKELLEAKKALQSDLRETEKVLRTVLVRGQQKQPGVANRALSALRSLRNEQIKERIEQSREMLKDGALTPTLEVEKKIEQSIAGLSKKLRELGGAEPQSKEDQIQQAASDASALRRELEDLQRQVDALRRSNQAQEQANRQALSQNQQGLSQSSQQGQQLQQQQGQGQAQQGQGRQGQQASQGQNQQGGQWGASQAWGNHDGNLRRMRDNFRRARQYARGLLQPWARGERWAVDARSIHRDLSEKEVEDFLNQPDLWERLLGPVREIESDLRASSEMNQLKKKLFTVREEEIPSDYQNLVEEYYRALSQDSEGRKIRK
ncbi:MAG: hypothetical protein HQM13_22180 [SAR324 cluster bacterium]|nr:hypothetical protein [SAR324 cluster bacterium]